MEKKKLKLTISGSSKKTINNIELAKFLKQNIYGNKIVIGMGAGSISNWIRNLQLKLK